MRFEKEDGPYQFLRQIDDRKAVPPNLATDRQLVELAVEFVDGQTTRATVENVDGQIYVR